MKAGVPNAKKKLAESLFHQFSNLQPKIDTNFDGIQLDKRIKEIQKDAETYHIEMQYKKMFESMQK